METLWDSVTLNYDLLTLFLGQIQEDENGEDGPPQVGVGGATLAVFTEVESDLEKVCLRHEPGRAFQHKRAVQADEIHP